MVTKCLQKGILVVVINGCKKILGVPHIQTLDPHKKLSLAAKRYPKRHRILNLPNLIYSHEMKGVYK